MPPTTSDEATRRWHGFAPHKQSVVDRLLEDQYMLCCYSELRADLYGLGYHIEHLENKSQHPQRTFDWPNLAASALSSEEGLPKLASYRAASGKVEVNFGGHAREKQDQVDLAQFVSIRDPQCATYFAYLSNGEMGPNLNRSLADQGKAEYTIRVLNLNSPYLVNLRRNLWDELDELFMQHLGNGWNIDYLCMGELIPHGRHNAPHYIPVLNSFFSLTRQFFGQVAEQTLLQHAPGLA
jgi:uncharacterized protein (TIGR02646 family)